MIKLRHTFAGMNRRILWSYAEFSRYESPPIGPADCTIHHNGY